MNSWLTIISIPFPIVWTCHTVLAYLEKAIYANTYLSVVKLVRPWAIPFHQLRCHALNSIIVCSRRALRTNTIYPITTSPASTVKTIPIFILLAQRIVWLTNKFFVVPTIPRGTIKPSIRASCAVPVSIRRTSPTGIGRQREVSGPASAANAVEKWVIRTFIIRRCWNALAISHIVAINTRTPVSCPIRIRTTTIDHLTLTYYPNFWQNTWALSSDLVYYSSSIARRRTVIFNTNTLTIFVISIGTLACISNKNFI